MVWLNERGAAVDIGRAFGFVFDDKEGWLKKVLIGGVIGIIPIVNFALYGYMIDVARNQMAGRDTPLPTWGDFGDKFMRGLYAIIIMLVYQLPTVLLYCVLIAVAGGLAGTIDANGEGTGATAGLSGVLLCLYPLIFISALGLSVLSFAALGRYVKTNVLSDALKFGEVLANVRANIGTWVMYVLIYIIAGIVGSLGSIACGIGVILTLAYAYMVMGHALGQATQKAWGGNVAPTSYNPQQF